MPPRKRKPGRSGTTVTPSRSPAPNRSVSAPSIPRSATVAASAQVAASPPSTASTTSAPIADTLTASAVTPEAPRPRPPLTRQEVKQIRAAQARAQEQHWVERYSARAEEKNAEARAKLVPLARNEHPLALRIAIFIALALSLGTLALMIFGVKVDHKPPSTSWIFYVIVMFACGVGMLRHWFQAVLAFLCLLGIALVILCALVVRFSNLLGLLIPLVLIVAGGTLFWKLVSVLARLQVPKPPAHSA